MATTHETAAADLLKLYGIDAPAIIASAPAGDFRRETACALRTIQVRIMGLQADITAAMAEIGRHVDACKSQPGYLSAAILVSQSHHVKAAQGAISLLESIRDEVATPFLLRPVKEG